MLDTDAENWEAELKTRPSIFINAVHHARELTTISQCVYTMMSLLHKYEHGQNEYVKLLKHSAIVFMPMVNPDGVAMIDMYFR